MYIRLLNFIRFFKHLGLILYSFIKNGYVVIKLNFFHLKPLATNFFIISKPNYIFFINYKYLIKIFNLNFKFIFIFFNSKFFFTYTFFYNNKNNFKLLQAIVFFFLNLIW